MFQNTNTLQASHAQMFNSGSLKWAENRANIDPTWLQNGVKMTNKSIQKLPNSIPNVAEGRENGAQMEPRRGQQTEKIKEKRQRIKKQGWTSQRRPSWAEKVANMAPTWSPKWSQDGQKIDAKIHHFLMPPGMNFEMDFHGFWVQKSRQVDTKMGSKIDVNSERRVSKIIFS